MRAPEHEQIAVFETYKYQLRTDQTDSPEQFLELDNPQQPKQSVTMKTFFAFAAAFVGVAVAAVATNNNADQSAAALDYLTTNSPAGHQAKEDGPAPPGCYWDGTAPFCAGSCPAGYTEEDRGSCGDGACCWTGYKVLCCKTAASGEN
ncbi:hypothetical protein CVT26_012799 [Gymnopilus dilepis]|uniref:Uncharacterized protein n=1 Tax=Gymnopilus dilepis TaxID=231916 RepID=A0A409Y444_9AGAR|nr:hypothetical protein CVT26_012799 [Gymnopilus dilepis]